MSVSAVHHENFIKRWKVAERLQRTQVLPIPEISREEALPAFVWAYQAACAILDQKFTINFTLQSLEATCSRLQALSPRNLSLIKRESWANLPVSKVSKILKAALSEAHFVYLFFSREYSDLSMVRTLPLLQWCQSGQNSLLNLHIFSQIIEHWPKKGISWLGFLPSSRQRQHQKKKTFLGLHPSFVHMKEQMRPFRHALAKTRSLTLRFALGELLRQEQCILRQAFQHVAQLNEHFPPPTVDLFRVFLHQQPNPTKASFFVASIDKALLKSTQCQRKMRVLARFMRSNNSLAILLKSDLEAKGRYVAQMVSIKDQARLGEVYAPAAKVDSLVVAWDRFTRGEINAFFAKVAVSKRKWLHELEEHVYSSDSDSEEAEDSSAFRDQNQKRPMGFFEDELEGEPEDSDEPATTADTGVKPAWWSHFQTLLSSESTPEHKNFHALVKETLKNMLLCSMKNQFIHLDHFGEHFRMCNRNIKRVATQLGLRSIREEENKHLRSIQRHLDLLFRRSAPLFGILEGAATQLKSNFELLLNFKKRFVVKVLFWYLLGRGVNGVEVLKNEKSSSAQQILISALGAFDQAVFTVMREECQSLLDEDLYTQIGEWTEEIQTSQGILEREMNAWRVPLPSSPDSEDLLWDHLQEIPWREPEQRQLLHAMLPPSIKLKSWKTVDRRTGQAVSTLKHWKKSMTVRREKCVTRWKKSRQSAASLALAGRILHKVGEIIQKTTVHIPSHVFVSHWVYTELLFASLSTLENSMKS